MSTKQNTNNTIQQELINKLLERNIQLSLENDQLRVEAPEGALDEQLVRALKDNKPLLIEQLKQAQKNQNLIQEESKIPQLVPDLASRYQPFALSDIQHAYWVGRKGITDLTQVSTYLYFELDASDKSLEPLNLALNKTIQRHDMLKAVFSEDGQQRILNSVPEDQIATYIISDTDEVDQHIEKLRDEMAQQVLPADQWPLFDIRASQLPQQQLRLHIGIDMLIADGLSLLIFFKEWYDYYQSSNLQLPDLTLSFRDYIIAEQAIKTSHIYAEAQSYWQQRIPQLPEAPQLPLKAPVEGKSQFKRRKFTLPAQRWDYLQQKAKQHGFSASNIILAAFTEILSRWSQQAHYCLNLTLFNRMPLHQEIQHIIGDFTSITLLEIDHRADNHFLERAQKTQAQLFSDLDHKAMSGVEVIREWTRSQQMGTHAAMPIVFTSALGLSHQADWDAGVIECIGKNIYSISQTPQVWLDHQVLEHNGDLICHWDAEESLFLPGVLDTLFAAFSDLIDCLIDQEDIWTKNNVVELPLYQQQIIPAFGASPIKNLAIDDQALLQSGFLAKAKTQAHRPAIITDKQQLSYGELSLRVNALAWQIIQQPLPAKSLIAIALNKGCEQIIAALAILRSGHAFMPLDLELPLERRSQLLKQAQCQLIITHQEQSTQGWAEEYPLIAIGVEPVGTIPSDVEAQLAKITPQAEDLAYVIFTSGSTGIPKGVMIDHRGAVNTLNSINRMARVTENDAVLCVSALSFDLSIYDIFGVLAAGGALVMPQQERRKDPSHWQQLIQQHQVTLWNSAPPLMVMLAEHLQFQQCTLPSLRWVMLSGDWIPIDLPNKVRPLCSAEVEIISLGGATEASIWSNFFPIHQIDPTWKSIPYGKALPNQTIQVLNQKLQPCPIGVTGEIFIGGIGLALGYWQDIEKTNEKFIVHTETGKRLYATGDLGCYQEDGNIEFLGRVDSQVKLKGHRIELNEINAVLNQCPGIERSLTYVAEHPNQGKQLVACITAETHHRSATNEPLESCFNIITPPTGQDQNLWLTAQNQGLALQAQLLRSEAESLANFETIWSELEFLSLQVIRHKLYTLSNGKDFNLQSLLDNQQLPAHQSALIRQWIDILVQQHELVVIKDKHHNLYQFTQTIHWQDIKQRIECLDDIDHPRIKPLLDYIKDCFIYQDQLLAGEIKPTELLFPNGDNQRAHCLYRTNPVIHLHNQVLAHVLNTFTNQWPKNTPIRILEVGAGTGGATEEILKVLPKENTKYIFTDITAFFLSSAKEQFSQYDFIEYQTYDINLPPLAQGYKLHEFDFVIAINVLHDAVNLNRVLSDLRQLLNAKGKLLALEASTNTAVQMATVAYLEGFGQFQDERLHTNLPLLSSEQWHEYFYQSGFTQSQAIPEQPITKALSQTVLVAENCDTIYELDSSKLQQYVSQRLPEYMVPKNYLSVDEFPITGNGKVDYQYLSQLFKTVLRSRDDIVLPETELEKKLLSCWKAVLNQHQISMDDSFFTIGGDSLLAIRLINQINSLLNLSLSIQTLFEHNSIRTISNFIESEDIYKKFALSEDEDLEEEVIL